MLAEILKKIREGFPGPVGDSRAVTIEAFIQKRAPEYAALMGIDKAEVLAMWERTRQVNCTNHYQEANIPDLDGVYVYETRDAFRAATPSGKFRCPLCKGESTDPQECNSGIRDENQKKCDWKSYGFFGTAGQGIRVFFKEWGEKRPTPLEIFKPIDFENQSIVVNGHGQN